jgi:hypothetical protein
MEQMMGFWYDWGVFVGVFLAAAAAIYIFFDSQQLATPGRANLPRLLSLGGLLLTLPGLYYRLTQMEAVDILADIFEGDGNFSLFFYLGLLGLLLALGALVYYFMRTRTESGSLPPSMANLSPPPPVAVVVEQIAPQPRPVPPTMPINQEPPPQAWLVVRAGPRVGTQFGLGTSRPNVIGRDPNKADIIIDEDSVSREHARVRFENGQFVIYDMASSGGTYVNGNIVQRQMLYDNDRINLGRVEMVYKKV